MNLANNNLHIKHYRRLAILKLLECSDTWDDSIYCEYDFSIDAMLRKHFDMPKKEIGKPPYEDMAL